MYTLRRITSENKEVNISLGKKYNIDDVRNLSKEELDRYEKLTGIKDGDGVNGFVVYEDGKEIVPLYSPSRYFIMTSEGHTFDNLNRRFKG